MFVTMSVLTVYMLMNIINIVGLHFYIVMKLKKFNKNPIIH